MRRSVLLPAVVLLALDSLACTATLSGLVPGAAQASGPLVTANPFATPTGTAFAPLPPTGTPLPTATATATPLATPTASDPWGYYAAPIEPSAIDIPREAQIISFDDDVINVLILGSDARPYTGGHRSDTIMIASLDPSEGTVTLLSVPRDLYVFIPGWRVDRINVADARGGPDLAKETVLYNFGIPIDYWVEIEFSGFQYLVDSLGGVDVNIGRYYGDECGGRYMSFYVGVQHMDGFTALCYARLRKASSDFDRLRRQQELVLAIFAKAVSLDALGRIPELYSQYRSLVDTDMGLDPVLPMIPLAVQVSGDPTRIRRFAVDSTMANGWRVPYSGASVLLPDYEAIQAMLATAFPP
ncbi:MAG TPA: LCP family protein [Anaerolineales bacterium]|nr:LCP family protein [Anaerolineales bacterium]